MFIILQNYKNGKLTFKKSAHHIETYVLKEAPFFMEDDELNFNKIKTKVKFWDLIDSKRSKSSFKI